MLISSNYKLIDKDTINDISITTEEQKKGIMANVPEVDRLLRGTYKKGLYALHSESIWQNVLLLQNLECYFEEGGLTAEEIAQYNKLAGFVKADRQLIFLPVDYELSEDGLRVSEEKSEIKYDPSIIGINRIQIMQNFQSTADGGSGYTVDYDEYSAIVTFGSLSQVGA